MLKWSYRKYLLKSGQIISAFSGWFERYMQLHDIAVHKVVQAMDKLNSSRPRKCLGQKTPHEVLEELSGLDARIVVQNIRNT